MLREGIINEINNSYWSSPDKWDAFGFDENTPIHKIFEVVLVNVAANFEIKWQNVAEARATNIRYYAARTIAFYSIYFLLKQHKGLSDDVIKELIGGNNYKIVLNYTAEITK